MKKLVKEEMEGVLKLVGADQSGHGRGQKLG